MPMNFAESNDRVFATERLMIDAEQDAAMQAELDHARELDRMQKRHDMAAALELFILDRRTIPRKGKGYCY